MRNNIPLVLHSGYINLTGCFVVECYLWSLKVYNRYIPKYIHCSCDDKRTWRVSKGTGKRDRAGSVENSRISSARNKIKNIGMSKTGESHDSQYGRLGFCIQDIN